MLLEPSILTLIRTCSSDTTVGKNRIDNSSSLNGINQLKQQIEIYKEKKMNTKCNVVRQCAYVHGAATTRTSSMK